MRYPLYLAVEEDFDLNRSLTLHLRRLLEGHTDNADAILTRVLPRMEQIARRALNLHGRDLPIEPNDLVNDAWIKSLRHEWRIENRSHFYAIVALAMRNLVLDYARAKMSLRRGGAAKLIGHYEHVVLKVPAPESLETLISLKTCMRRLDQSDPDAARVVDLHYFAGFSFKEIAGISGLKIGQVKSLWTRGRNALKEGVAFAPEKWRKTVEC